MDKNCEGCPLYDKTIAFKPLCVFKYYDVIELCPCQNCIVITMCDKHCDIRNNKFEETGLSLERSYAM